MSSKQDVLKVLRSDVDRKVAGIKDKYADRIQLAYKDIEAEKERIRQDVNQLVITTLRSVGYRVRSDTKLSVGFDNDDRWSEVNITGRRVRSVRRFERIHRRLQSEQDREYQRLQDRADNIRRKIALHGVNAEVLRLLDSL